MGQLIFEINTEVYDHSFMLVWWLFILEVAPGVYPEWVYPGLNGSCSSAHKPNGKPESSVTETYWMSDHKALLDEKIGKNDQLRPRS